MNERAQIRYKNHLIFPEETHKRTKDRYEMLEKLLKVGSCNKIYIYIDFLNHKFPFPFSEKDKVFITLQSLLTLSTLLSTVFNFIKQGFGLEAKNHHYKTNNKAKRKNNPRLLFC